MRMRTQRPLPFKIELIVQDCEKYDMSRVVFLCKGSRGDVHPLLAIALAYKESHSKCEVVVVCSPSTVSAALRSCVIERNIILVDLPEPVMPLSLERAHELSSDTSRLSVLTSEAVVCFQACKPGANLIAFNLFSLEGYFIALHLGVPCIALSPHVANRGPPPGFEKRLAGALPRLYQDLKSSAAASSQSVGVVSYKEVDHWMWRLFLNDYGEVCEALGLRYNLPFGPSNDDPLPPSTTLLYGVSESVLPRQPYWPQSVKLCGYWLLPDSLQGSPDPLLVAKVDSIRPRPLLYIGFGSMESYMISVSWKSFLGTLDSALELVEMEALLQCKKEGQVHECYSQLVASSSHQQQLERVHLWTGEAPHHWLFPQCSAIMHHGGSGTVASALLARKPQLICPVMFDQRFWAEHLSWRGLAVQCASVERLGVGELRQALGVACSGALDKAIEEAASVGESGVKVAVEEIEILLGEARRNV